MEETTSNLLFLGIEFVAWAAIGLLIGYFIYRKIVRKETREQNNHLHHKKEKSE